MGGASEGSGSSIALQLREPEAAGPCAGLSEKIDQWAIQIQGRWLQLAVTAILWSGCPSKSVLSSLLFGGFPPAPAVRPGRGGILLSVTILVLVRGRVRELSGRGPKKVVLGQRGQSQERGESFSECRGRR